jgi:hypothetical protein
MLLDLKPDRAARKARFGKSKATAEIFDLVFNAEALTAEQMAELIEASVACCALKERGYLSHAAEAQLQFQMRLKLARYGIVPTGNLTLRQKMFAHHSEEMFANLLDFYRIAWEYEPRSFPVQYAQDGAVLESFFTPDFYLPEFDLYCGIDHHEAIAGDPEESQSAALARVYPRPQYPGFHQKDFENLIFKYGLSERSAQA